MIMKMSFVGAGYVGLVTGAAFAADGHDVKLVDIDAKKVGAVNRGESPIYEPGLPALLKKHVGKNLRAQSSFAGALEGSDAAFICVGTPQMENGSTDLKYVEGALQAVAEEIRKREGYMLVVIKSTVPPGTAIRAEKTLAKLSGKKPGVDFGVASNPEFLREGSALEDCAQPDRIIIGTARESDAKMLGRIYERHKARIIRVTPTAAEMIKYASNSFLAAKISYANEIARMCESLGLDVDRVMEGVGADRRIGASFLNAGAGFGGSCFPKDVKSLAFEARKKGVAPILLDAALEVNELQKKHAFAILEGMMKVQGKTVAVLGLSFKENTDDVRESAAIDTIALLQSAGASVRAYDPKANAAMQKICPGAKYCASAADCLDGADAAIIITAWDEFRKPAAYYRKLLGDAPLVDARRLLDEKDAAAAGLNYHCIGRGKG